MPRFLSPVPFESIISCHLQRMVQNAPFILTLISDLHFLKTQRKWWRSQLPVQADHTYWPLILCLCFVWHVTHLLDKCSHCFRIISGSSISSPIMFQPHLPSHQCNCIMFVYPSQRSPCRLPQYLHVFWISFELFESVRLHKSEACGVCLLLPVFLLLFRESIPPTASTAASIDDIGVAALH